jgi:hypothetical protein
MAKVKIFFHILLLIVEDYLEALTLFHDITLWLFPNLIKIFIL